MGRVLWAHGHKSNAYWPVHWGIGYTVYTWLLIPKNWVGTNKVRLWQLGTTTEDVIPDITIDIGTCGEIPGQHTESRNGDQYSLVTDEYCCWDLTTNFATVLANLASGDMIRVEMNTDVGVDFIYFIGLEVEEA